MIGKQVKGTSFREVLNYLHDKEGAQLLGGNMVGETPRELAAEFRVSRQLNLRLKKVVYHASLSLPKTEHLNDVEWRAIATTYLQGMGFGENQYVIYRHTDQDHDHIHMVASRIRLTDGKTVKDSWDYRRSEVLIRKLEQEYQLEAVAPSWEQDRRAPTTGERRQLERTGKASVRVQLQMLIDGVVQQKATMPQVIDLLQRQGIEVKVYSTHKGIRGMSYQQDGVALSGTQLGKAYTFPGLQRYRGVSYCPERDDELIGVLMERGIKQERYQQMWQRYSREVTARNRVKLDLRVGQQALADGYSAKEVGRMLVVGSPYVREIEQSQGKDKARQYVNQTVRAIAQGEQAQRSSKRQKLQLER